MYVCVRDKHACHPTQPDPTLPYPTHLILILILIVCVCCERAKRNSPHPLPLPLPILLPLPLSRPPLNPPLTPPHTSLVELIIMELLNMLRESEMLQVSTTLNPPPTPQKRERKEFSLEMCHVFHSVFY